MKKFVLLPLVLLSACSPYAPDRLRSIEIKGDPYHVALAQGYLAMAEREEKRFNWANAWYFGDKGMLAAYGREVEPETLGDWNIPEETRAEISKAREALVKAVSESSVKAQPQAAAQAQVSFDCWVKEQESARPADKDCRDGYYAAMKTLTGGLPDYVDTNPPLVVSDSYLAYFGLDEDLLNAEAMALAESMSEELIHSQAPYQIVINGHADTSGTEQHNMDLSRRRAERFRAALVEQGVPAERIHLFAFGETDPKVPTGDGVREAINRRVEIFMNDQPQEASQEE